VASLLDRGAPSDSRALTAAAARSLLLHPYPFNVRELERALAVAAALAGPAPIDRRHLPEAMRAPPPPRSAEAAPPHPLTDGEQRHRDELRGLLEQHAGNVAAVARALGKARMQVHRWLKRYALDPDSFRR